MRTAPEWAGDRVASDKFARNKAELPRYAEIEARTEDRLRRIVGDLQRSGDVPAAQREFARVMRDAENQALVAGRRARGDTRTEISAAEAKMLAGRHSRNMRYAAKFFRDVTSGAGVMDYGDRAAMYAQSLWSIYSRGETTDWENPEAENARYVWVLDVDAEHCATCLERAGTSRAQGGLTWDELSEMGWPGEGTDCATRCRCSIEVRRSSTVLPERLRTASVAPDAASGLSRLEDLLGGPQMPLRAPGAGVPFVRVTPPAVNASISASPDPEILARMLPLIPVALARPAMVTVVSPTTRVYDGEGLTITISRNPQTGIWEMILVSLASVVDVLERLLRREAA